MTHHTDWLSHFLNMMTVVGQLDIHCSYHAPWRLEEPESVAHEMPYHLILSGSAVVEIPESGESWVLNTGDIVLLPHGMAHILHDGSRLPPIKSQQRQGEMGWIVDENEGQGQRLDMLCGRFIVRAPYDRLMRTYFPSSLIVRSVDARGSHASTLLTGIVDMMRIASASTDIGSHAILNALSSALFTLVLRTASEAEQVPKGLLSLAGYPRLAPAISAILTEPAHPWGIAELAKRCSMSRATFLRHFKDRLGVSAMELLTDIRMNLAASELKRSAVTTEVVAASVGYQSVSAFRRVFTEKLGCTPGEWRRLMHRGDS